MDPRAFHHSGDALYDYFAAAVHERRGRLEAEHVREREGLLDSYGLGLLRGDEMLCRAALAVCLNAGSIAEHKPLRPWEPYFAHVLPEGSLMAAEAKFGGDPRYWQLLSWQEYQRGKMNQAAADYVPAAWAPLLRAVELGIADGLTYLLLRPMFAAAEADFAQVHFDRHLQTQERWSEAELSASGGSLPPSQQSYESRRKHYEDVHSQALVMVETLGLDLAGLYARALAASPQWAQVHYARAQYAAQRGDWQTALDSIEAGNEAELRRMLVPFPLSVALRCAEGGRIAGELELVYRQLTDGDMRETVALTSMRALLLRTDMNTNQRRRLNMATIRMYCHLLRSELLGGSEANIVLLRLNKLLEWVLHALAGPLAAPSAVRLQEIHEQLIALTKKQAAKGGGRWRAILHTGGAEQDRSEAESERWLLSLYQARLDDTAAEALFRYGDLATPIKALLRLELEALPW